MEVVETSSAILCNSEVLQFLREQREENLLKKNLYRKDNKGGQAATVILETLTHLDKSPCANLNPERVAAFLDKLSATELTLNSAEKLHILNHCPTVSKKKKVCCILFADKRNYNKSRCIRDKS